MRFATLLVLAALAAGPVLAQPTRPGADGESVRVTADDGGFRVRSADQRYGLRIRGDAQADGRVFLGDAEELGVDQMFLRRARLILQGTLGGRYDFKLQPNFARGTVEMQDAFVDARFSPAFAVQAGKFKVPLGLEWLRSPTDFNLVELGLPSALVPRRDVGLMVHGAVAGNRVGYELGVFNGALDGQSADGDASDGKDLAARLFVQPFRTRDRSPLRGLGVGFGVTVGEEAGTFAAPGVPTYRTAGGRLVGRYRAGTADSTTVLAGGARVRHSPQAFLFSGPVGVIAELVASRQTVRLGAATADLTTFATLVSASWLVTGEDATYGRVRPRRPLGEAGGIGAVEIAARVNTLRFDADAFPVFASPAASAREALAIAVGVNWYPTGSVKVMANVERTTFSLSDQAPAGTPAIPSEDLLLTRVQIAF